ncbi:hypothetical protein ACWM35_12135 [Neobacillus sp. K501]
MVLAALRWGDRENVVTYYPTILYFILGDLLKNPLLHNHRMWEYQETLVGEKILFGHLLSISLSWHMSGCMAPHLPVILDDICEFNLGVFIMRLPKRMPTEITYLIILLGLCIPNIIDHSIADISPFDLYRLNDTCLTPISI